MVTEGPPPKFNGTRDILMIFRDSVRAASLLRDAAAERESIADRHGQRWALLQLGQALVAARDYDQAIAAYETGVDLAMADGDTHAVSFGETQLGDLLRYQGKYEEAEGHLERALRAAQAAGLRVEEGAARKTLGMMANSRRNHKAAIAHYDTALTIANSSGNAFEVARIQSLLGSAYLSVGKVQEAEALATEALRSAEHADWLDLQISTRLLLLRGGRARGDITAALEHGREALDVASRRPPDIAGIDVELELSRLHLLDGDLDAAKTHATSALSTADTIGDQPRAALAAIELGATLRRLGEKETALELYYGHLPVDNQIIHARMQAAVGLLEADLGRPDLGAEQIQIAETLYRELGDIHQQAHCLDILSKVYLQQGDLLRSRRSRRHARELWPTLGSCCKQ
jgi:tetratricopeptide (TPR) repeat protein